MKAAIYEGPGKLSLVDLADPVALPDGVVVRVSDCGICGSDVHSLASGKWVGSGQVMGHELSGSVADIGRDVSELRIGERVVLRPLINCGHCWYCQRGMPYFCPRAIGPAYTAPGGFAEYLSVPHAVVDEVLFRTPDGLSDQEGALIEPLSVALHAFNLSRARAGDTVLVLGSGTIGLTCAQLFQRLGHCSVIIADYSPFRLRIAEKVGVTHTVDASEDLPGAVKGLVGASKGAGFVDGLDIDIVVEAAGAASATNQALQMVRHGGTVVSIALFEQAIPIDPNYLVQKELRWLGSYGYSTEFSSALALVEDGTVNVRDLVSQVFPLDEITQAFRVQSNPHESMKVLVHP